jgi:hypothetical protein
MLEEVTRGSGWLWGYDAALRAVVKHLFMLDPPGWRRNYSLKLTTLAIHLLVLPHQHSRKRVELPAAFIKGLGGFRFASIAVSPLLLYTVTFLAGRTYFWLLRSRSTGWWWLLFGALAMLLECIK